MEYPALSCCYFPTTVVFIDDHESFLKNITKSINPNLITKSFTKISAFKDFLEKNPSIILKSRWIELRENVEFQQMSINQQDVAINLNLLYEQIYKFNRYNEFSVAIVDYAMPEINGIDLCQMIKKINPNIKTLLLTGEADHQTAVDAFNNRLIDKFIKKGSDEDFIDNLNAAILQLTRDYFTQTFSSLNMNLTGVNPLLSQNAFLELFYKVYKQHNACEYYLVDPMGCFLMLNKQGEAMWLIVKDEQNYETYSELVHSENHFDQKNIELIQEKKLIPFYHGEYLNLPLPDEWSKHLLPSSVLKINDEAYPYAEYKGFSHTIIDPKKVHSFNEYLDDL